MKINISKSILISCVFFGLLINCQKEKYITYVYGEAGLQQPCSTCQVKYGAIVHFPYDVYVFYNTDSIGMRDFKNCRLYLNKGKEYSINYHFMLYTYNDTTLFEWEDSGQYFIDDKRNYHFESNTGHPWESLGIYWLDTKSLVLFDIPNDNNCTLQLAWDFRDGDGVIEEVKIN